MVPSFGVRNICFEPFSRHLHIMSRCNVVEATHMSDENGGSTSGFICTFYGMWFGCRSCNGIATRLLELRERIFDATRRTDTGYSKSTQIFCEIDGIYPDFSFPSTYKYNGNKSLCKTKFVLNSVQDL